MIESEIGLSYSFHLGNDKNKTKKAKQSAKNNSSNTTSFSNNAIQNIKQLGKVNHHNLRKYDNNQGLIKTIKGTNDIVNDVKNLYKLEFESTRIEYNNKQTREDRKIKDYFYKISDDTKHDLACEIIIELGDMHFWENKSQEEKYNKYATSSLYKELMKDSIDYAIENAKDYNEFIKILQDLGYVITNKNGTLSIRRDPYKRNTRIERQFGNKYSKENIYKRILEIHPIFPYSSNPMVLITRTYENYNKQKEKHYQNKGSIAHLIYQYEKLFGINTEITLKSNMTRITPELIAEIKKMDEYSNQAKFLAKNNINTEQELLDFEKSAYARVNPLKSKRENLWKKLKRAKTDKEKQTIENEIVEISKQINPITEEIKHCNNIMQRVEKIKQHQLHEQVEQDKVHFEREQEKNKKDRNKAR